MINKECRNSNFDVITDNEALVIDPDPSNKQNLTWQPQVTAQMENLTLGYFKPHTTCPTMSCLPEIEIWKLEYFGCAKKNISGPVLKNIQAHLKHSFKTQGSYDTIRNDRTTGDAWRWCCRPCKIWLSYKQITSKWRLQIQNQ